MHDSVGRIGRRGWGVADKGSDEVTAMEWVELEAGKHSAFSVSFTASDDEGAVGDIEGSQAVEDKEQLSIVGQKATIMVWQEWKQ
ncbi:hypothetical protein BHM03_00041963 [Ensete ventricosum]|nr:hypothetical protein BHM03_00041963 [Ensete ventricosum]